MSETVTNSQIQSNYDKLLSLLGNPDLTSLLVKTIRKYSRERIEECIQILEDRHPEITYDFWDDYYLEFPPNCNFGNRCQFDVD